MHTNAYQKVLSVQVTVVGTMVRFRRYIKGWRKHKAKKREIW